jgi:hypothetical protein
MPIALMIFPILRVRTPIRLIGSQARPEYFVAEMRDPLDGWNCRRGHHRDPTRPGMVSIRAA